MQDYGYYLALGVTNECAKLCGIVSFVINNLSTTLTDLCLCYAFREIMSFGFSTRRASF
jgi:hypothetical protein